jgi:hypothetical protein
VVVGQVQAVLVPPAVEAPLQGEQVKLSPVEV